MFIRLAEFEHFIHLKSGLDVNKLILNFSRQQNPICVFIGRNGRGKTSLLGLLTPFATLGSLDSRNTVRLIIPGKKGFKHLIIVDDDSEYDIRHYYLPSKDTFTIKSYISVNGKELNENGNVRSFEKLVSDLLGLEPDYLKLIRIGENVSNLIKSSSTERKVFMGKMLEDVDVYLKQYKQIVQKEKETKAVVMHIIDELAKTNIDNVDSAKKKLKKTQKEVSRITSQWENAEQERTKISYSIELIGLPTGWESRLKELEKTLKTFDSILEEIESNGLTIHSIEEAIKEYMEKRAYAQASHHGLLKEQESLLNQLDDITEELQKLNVEIEKEKATLNIDSLKEYLIELRKKRNECYRAVFEETQPPFTKEEFEDFVVFLKNTQILLNTTYEFGKGPVKEVLHAMKKRQDIPNLITSSLIVLESRENAERMSLIDRLISKYSMKYSCEDNDCPYRKLHKELMSIKDAVPVTDVRYTAEFYQMMKLAYDNLNRVFSGFMEYKKLISMLPNNIQCMFTIDELFSNISKGRNIYDEKVVNEYLSFFTERENYLAIVAEVQELESQINTLEGVSKLGYLEDRRTICEEKINQLRIKIPDLTEKVELQVEEVDRLSKALDGEELKRSALMEYSTLKSEYDELVQKSKLLVEKEEELRSQTKVCLELKNWKSQLEEEMNSLVISISRFQQLTKELDTQNEIFEDYSHLKYALSNKTGLPLYHIKSYLTETRDVANELLDIVFEGRLYLEKFEISENEFRIPYVKNGRKISDVSSASDGERSFFNMAISSALRLQCGTKYNIGLYDEPDGPFDDTNRQKFIPVLERLMEKNKVEQSFLITHNQMFQKYPVDKIDFDVLENSTIDVSWE